MIDPNAWRDAYKMSVEHGPETAVSYLLEQVKTKVKTFLQEPPLGEQPMLPRLADLLAEAAGRDTDSGITQDYLDEFKGKLAGLLPASFTPQGSGREGPRVLPRRRRGTRHRGVPKVVDQPAHRHSRLPADRHRIDLGSAVPHGDGHHRGWRSP